MFQQKRVNLDQLLNRILGQVKAVQGSLSDHAKVTPNSMRDAGMRAIHWTPPTAGWYKLNVDGAVVNYGEIAGCGGVVRDELGNFCVGFAARLGPCSITEAELWRILKGMQMAREKGLDNVQIDSDSKAAVRLVLGACSPLHPSFNLVKDIRDMMEEKSGWVLQHSLRETNHVADGFAKHGLGIDNGCRFFHSLPSFVGEAFKADYVGVCFPRGF